MNQKRLVVFAPVLLISLHVGAMASPIEIGLSATAFTDDSADGTSVFVAVPAFSQHGVAAPIASGQHVSRIGHSEIDYSNTALGYVKIRFIDGTSNNLRVLITTPHGAQYQYRLCQMGSWETFPLSGGDGEYQIRLFEQVTGNRFALVNGVTTNVTLSCQFAPFLRPNQFVNFNENSAVVSKAAELVSGLTCSVEMVSKIYNFVVENIEYDFELAASVQSGYVPNVDEILAARKGICFDYAALLTAMLRSQGVPARLEIGYANLDSGVILHAWVSVHTGVEGWINDDIFVSGIGWTLLDPTFASTGNKSPEVMKFIGDRSNYMATHFH